ANIEQTAVFQRLRGNVIKMSVLEQCLHLAGINLQVLNAKRPECHKMTFAISANAGGLEDDFSAFARHPMRRGVEGIPFSQFLDAAFTIQFQTNVGCAVLMQDAECEIAGLPRHREMPDARAVVIPQTPLFCAERFGLE